jgi:hypothetical protein
MKRVGFLVVLLLVALSTALAWLGCSGASDQEPSIEGTEGGSATSSGGDPTTVGDPPGPGAKPTSGATTAGATDANLKVAFIGDTATGSNFDKVLALVKSENASMLMIQGDLTYSGAKGSDWFPHIDNAINKDWPGSKATVTIPYFVSRGNHDADWGNISKGLAERMAKWGVRPDNNTPSAGNYSVTHRGLKMVMADIDETSNPTRAAYVEEQLAGDDHLWKICSWHRNQRNSNVGPKSDEMGWQIYESCRKHGAIVAQGHSHTYSRSKTLTNDAAQTVDANCKDPFNLCVSPGRHFFFDSSLGGVDTRTLDSVSSKAHWASTYSGSFGALFIEFNIDGDPNKARGYFKTVSGTIVDPPASSGKTSFVIQRTE